MTGLSLELPLDIPATELRNDGFGIIGIQPTWHCLGTNMDGSPIHPLASGRNRIPDTAKLKKWIKPSVPRQPGENA